MNIKEVGKAMQDIEFVLFSLKVQDQLRAGEIEQAHNKAQQIMEQYLQPLNAFSEEETECKNFEKYIILVNDIVIGIEASNKAEAIDRFKNEFKNLYEMDWTIKRLLHEIDITGDYKR